MLDIVVKGTHLESSKTVQLFARPGPAASRGKGQSNRHGWKWWQYLKIECHGLLAQAWVSNVIEMFRCCSAYSDCGKVSERPPTISACSLKLNCIEEDSLDKFSALALEAFVPTDCAGSARVSVRYT